MPDTRPKITIREAALIEVCEALFNCADPDRLSSKHPNVAALLAIHRQQQSKREAA